MGCLDRETAITYLRGDLDPEEAERWSAHVAKCDACRRRLEEISGLVDDVRHELMLADISAEGDWPKLEGLIQQSANRTAGRRLSPKSIAVATASLVVIVAILWNRGTSVSAAEILERAAVAERLLAQQPDKVMHRVLTVEERRGAARTLVSRRRVEAWRKSGTTSSARRAFDDAGRVVAVAWVDAAGTQVVRSAGPPRVEPARSASELFIAGEPWQVDLSAQVFSTLLPSRERARVTEAAGTISLYYEFGDGAPIAATMLVLSGRDLRAIEQTIQVGRGEDRREYRLAEDRIAFLSGDAVPPGMFEPELAAPDRRASPVTALRPAPRPPSPERLFGLEIEALRLLDAAGALLGEQVTVIRTQDQVRIRAMVDSDGRKRELERAIEPLAGDSRVVIDVQTFAAVAERQPDSGSSIRFREVDVPGGDIPVGPQLRRFFGSAAGQAATPETQEQVRAFARRVVEHSRLTVQHAWAIKRLQARYSPHEAAALPADARSTWRRMIGDHARNVAERGEIIRALLHPVFMVGGEAPTEAPRLERSPPSDVRQIAEQLLDLVHTQDQAVRTAFSASSDPGRGDTFIATRQFFERLDELVNLARRLA